MPQSSGGIYDTATLVESGAVNAALSADQSRLFVAMEDGNIRVYDIATRQLLDSWDIGATLGAISMSEDGSFLLVVEQNAGLGQSAVHRVDTSDGTFQTYLTAGSAFYDVEIVDGDTAIFTGGHDEMMRLDLDTGQFTPLSGGVFYSNGRSPMVEGGRYTLIAEPGISNGPLFLYDELADAIVAYGDSYQSSNSGFNWGSQAISEEAGLVLQFIYYGTINVYDLNLDYLRTVEVGAPIDGLAFDESGENVYVRFESGAVGRYSVNPWDLVEEFAAAPAGWDNSVGYGEQLLLVESGRYVIVTEDDDPSGQIQIIDTTMRDELLRGTDGADRLAGGLGDDRFIVNHPGDIVVERAGEGLDRVTATVSFTLGGNVERLQLSGLEAIDGTGNALGNVISGNSADNRINGLAGDDLLDGGLGNDLLDGGTGIDTATYADGEKGVFVNLSLSGAQNTGAGRDTLVSVENLAGSGFADRLTGDASANALRGNGGDDRLYGEAGADELDGGAGLDRLYGGAGDDIYVIRDSTDYAFENANEGYDRVYSAVGHVLHANVEELRLQGSAAIDGYGNDGANNLYANSAANELNGWGGDDRLFGDGGDDRLYGSDGDDRLFGESGNDRLDGGAGYDRMYGGTGDDVYLVRDATDHAYEAAGEGLDTVYASITHVLRDNVEVLRLTGSAAINGYGNEGADTLVGNGGANRLYGQAGDDRLFGGHGDDRLYGREGDDRLDAGAGMDLFYGGTGEDDFLFRGGDFAASGADRILDFSQAEGDQIHLSTVDANLTIGGDQGFAFIGTGDFTGTAGELRYDQINGNTYVWGDTNGDGAADFIIRLDGLHMLESGDFIL